MIDSTHLIYHRIESTTWKTGRLIRFRSLVRDTSHTGWD